MSDSILIMADTHAHNHAAFAGERVSDGLSILDELEGDSRYPGCNRRALAIAAAIEDAIAFAVRGHIKTILLLGDVFHTKGNVPLAVYNAMTKVFGVAREQDVTVLAIPGNHDYVGKTANWSSLNTLYSLPNVAVSFAPSIEVISTDNFQLAAMMIPYMSRKDRILEEIGRLSKELVHILKSGQASHAGLFMHVSVKGATTGPHEYVMREEVSLEELPLELFHIIVSGHVHMHQVLRRGQYRFVYCGGLLQHNFGERNYKPGFLKIDLTPETADLKFVENKKSPRFDQVTLALREDLEEVVRAARAEATPSMYLRVNWTGGVVPADIEIPTDRIDLYRVPKTTTKPRLEVDLFKETPESLIRRYVEETAITRPDREELIEMGLELLR
jgi:DNA repair exonuclease SbcCD nuclease subunit